MTQTALAVRHVAFEDLGLIEPVLNRLGYDVLYLDAGVHEISAETAAEADLLVVLGGPIGAADAGRYPFLTAEVDAIRERVRRGGRTLGICLGAQLLARALGAGVKAAGHSEIGYTPLTLTDEGLRSPLRHLADVPVLHWHQERFDIPAGAVRLASTPACPNQAFAVGPHVLGLQFHLEADPRALERWLIGHAQSLTTLGLHPQPLRDAAAGAGPALAAAATRVLTEWLLPAPGPAAEVTGAVEYSAW
ncbi:MAG TPA: glutamine amidotransferase [Amycolatopsis sp.]|jgi:GMP synthase (glutamine-hydrolysing)